MSPEPTDVLVLGTGVAGCAAALAAARGGASVTIVTRADAGPGVQHLLRAGRHRRAPPGRHAGAAGRRHRARRRRALFARRPVSLIAREGPDLVQTLLVEELGVPFDRDGAGFHWTLEGAHSVPRVLHVKDETGAPIESALIAACRNEKNIHWRLETTAVDLLTLSHDSTDPADRYRPPAVIGAYLLSRNGGDGVAPQLARETILATGGLGQVYLHTTNPPGARGDGFAMARRAGARLLNLEYIQFHPTALVHPKGRLLLTEALRGEGARITDISGTAVPAGVPSGRGARAARRRGARDPPAACSRSDEPHVLLDISHKKRGLDPEPLPGARRALPRVRLRPDRGPRAVVPAAHYSCGGVAVDGDGRTALGHLRAVGEVSCTGVHGANRLASTSLLEGLLWGWRAGRAAAREAERLAVASAPARAALGARARARGPGADRAGLDGHPPHDVELRRAAALGAAARPRRPDPRRAAGRDRELLPPRHDVGRSRGPAQRRADGARDPPRGLATTASRGAATTGWTADE